MSQFSPLTQLLSQMQPTTTLQQTQLSQQTGLSQIKKPLPKKKAVDSYTSVWDKDKEDVEYDVRFFYHVRKNDRRLFKNKAEAKYLFRKCIEDFCRSIQIKSKESKFKRLKTVSKERVGSGRKPVTERVIQTGITIYLTESDLKRIGGIQLLRAMCRDYITTIIAGEPYFIPDREYLPRPSKMKPQQITVYLKRSEIEARFNDMLTFKEVIATWFTSLMNELSIENYSIARFKKEQIIKYL